MDYEHVIRKSSGAIQVTCFQPPPDAELIYEEHKLPREFRNKTAKEPIYLNFIRIIFQFFLTVRIHWRDSALPASSEVLASWLNTYFGVKFATMSTR